MKAHTLTGLANPVYLPDDIQVEIKIIPSDHTNVRSNQKRTAAEVKYSTRHETANYATGADAEMHYRYLMSNPSPAAGYNCVSDDKKIIQLTPYDEVTCAAGTALGNRTSDHHELCTNADIDHAKARRIAAALDAGVLYARGITPQAGLLQHNYWYGKNCPALMRANNNAIWNGSYYPMVKQFWADIDAFVKSGTTPTEPTKPTEPSTQYAAPSRIAAADGNEPVAILDNGATMILSPLTVATIRPTARKQYADANSADVGPVIPGGSTFTVRRLIVNADGSMWWYTPFATRVKYADTKIVGGV